MAVTDLFTMHASQPEGETLMTAGRVKAPAPTVRRESKSSSAYRTISEVAADLGVATHVLRFWESKFPQIQPLKKSGGRRYYRPEDIALLRHIQTLLYDQGMAIRGVQAYLAKTSKRDLKSNVQATALSTDGLITELKAIRQLLAEESAA